MIIQWPLNKNVGDIYVSPAGTKWKWNGKAWVSLKESDVVYLTGPTGPSGTNLNSITYQFAHGPMDPVDNMSYYIGNISDLPAQSTSIMSRRIKSLVSGKVKQVSIMTQIIGDLGSNESQLFTLKNNTTGESTIITSNYTNNLNSQLDNYQLDNPLNVSIDDELEIIWQVYIFKNSPTGVRHNFIISIG